jgi:DNA-binding transcriptional MocR family regulator
MACALHRAIFEVKGICWTWCGTALSARNGRHGHAYGGATVRLNLSSSAPEQIEEGIAWLGHVIREAMP